MEQEIRKGDDDFFDMKKDNHYLPQYKHLESLNMIPSNAHSVNRSGLGREASPLVQAGQYQVGHEGMTNDGDSLVRAETNVSPMAH